jgi:ABC-2 type transport system ATP-binding protein
MVCGYLEEGGLAGELCSFWVLIFFTQECLVGALTVESISKTFDAVRAVDGISLSVPEGQIYGMLGPNGAGKTTMIRMILGIFEPDSGAIRYGQNGVAPPPDRVGYLPEERGLYTRMRVLDVLTFLGEIKSMSRLEAREKGKSWLDRFEMPEWADRPVEQLSKGMQQKVQFISTVLHDPDLLVLDEPFSGLDPINTALMKDVILELKEAGKTLIFSTHQMEEAERLCEKICLINKGQKVLEGGVAEVKARHGRNRVVLAFRGDDGFLKDETLVKRADNYGQYVEVELQEGADPQVLLRRALDGAQIQRFEVADPSLREIFILSVGEDDDAE